MTLPPLEISVQNPAPVSFDIDAFVGEALKLKDVHSGVFDFNFVTAEESRQVNTTHLGHDYATDTITFNLGSPTDIVGDVYICPEVAAENAQKFGGSFDDEIRLLVVHSILHLLGYTDYTEADQAVMTQEQSRILAQLSASTR